MKITKPLYLYGEQRAYTLQPNGDYGPGIAWTITSHPSEMFGPLAAQTTVDIDVADDWDPRPGQVEQLRQQQQELRAKVEIEVRKIDEHIASLLALENHV